MTVDIFIRTYSKDLEWLKYCLKSITKYATGFRDVIICIPEHEKHLISGWGLTKEKVFKWSPVSANGYVDQQINKLSAHKFTDADYVLFIDSDTCFKKKTNVTDYFTVAKPNLIKTRYELVGDAICWKEPTESILKTEVHYEYMRRMPLLYKTQTLKNLEFHLGGFKQIAKENKLSEFNLIGAFIELIEKDEDYHIINSEIDPLPPITINQEWSWGGLNEEIRSKLEEIVK